MPGGAELDVLDYSGNVAHYVGRYAAIARARGLDKDDLMQVGYIAVLDAWRAHRKNGAPDATFAGYVGPWIRGAMHRAVHTPAALMAGVTVPIDDDLDPARAESDEGGDQAVAMLRPLPDRQALALELHLGLDGTPGRPIAVVADMMRGNAERLIKTGLANLRRHLNPPPTGDA